MKIAFCAPEVVPFAKTGGLADVAGALPKEIAKLDHDIRIIMPAYKQCRDQGELLTSIDISLPEKNYTANILQTTLPDTKIIVYLIDYPPYFDRPGLYQEGGHDYADNAMRFIFYSAAVLALLAKIAWQPDIIHANDWQTALIPAMIRLGNTASRFQDTASIFTIHNLAYQGVFAPDVFRLTGFDACYFSSQYLEYYGQINFMKAGLIFSTLLNTVSPRYSEEIQMAEFGHGLEGVLASRTDDLSGILNGLDYNAWDPATDQTIVSNFDANHLTDKQPNKAELQKIMGLPSESSGPLIGMVSRLDRQKGLDILVQILARFADLPAQFALLGTGDPEYERALVKLAKQYPQNIAVKLQFDATLATKIYAGADIFMMPSHYEPCGLGQLISLKYGTIPIVRKTGGLADTIIDYHRNKRSGNGFVFSEYNPEALWDALNRTTATYRESTAWTKLMYRAMTADYSWQNAAKKYLKLYKKALQKHK